MKKKDEVSAVDFCTKVLNEIKNENGPLSYDDYLQALDALNGLEIEDAEQWLEMLNVMYEPVRECFVGK